MKNKETSSKRLTFQGLINVEQEKVPEKSRSKSKNRSKATSITRTGTIPTNRSSQPTSFVAPKIQQKMTNVQSSKSETVSKTANESIFRNTKKNTEQQLMKKIIKLKNATTRVQNNIKKMQGNKNESEMFDNKENNEDKQKLEQMHNFLQEFDAEIRKQTKEIGQSYLQQIQDFDHQLQNNQIKIPQFKPLAVPHSTPLMPNLQSKLQQIQDRWFKK